MRNKPSPGAQVRRTFDSSPSVELLPPGFGPPCPWLDMDLLLLLRNCIVLWSRISQTEECAAKREEAVPTGMSGPILFVILLSPHFSPALPARERFLHALLLARFQIFQGVALDLLRMCLPHPALEVQRASLAKTYLNGEPPNSPPFNPIVIARFFTQVKAYVGGRAYAHAWDGRSDRRRSR